MAEHESPSDQGRKARSVRFLSAPDALMVATNDRIRLKTPQAAQTPTMQRKCLARARSGRMRTVLVLCALIALGTPVAAEDYPSRPIRLVLGFTAGGPTDIPARFLAERLGASLGKPVVVENKPG